MSNEKHNDKSVGPKITLNRAVCPERVPDRFEAEINCSRYGIALNAVVQIRFRDPDVKKSTGYSICRAVNLRALPNYMDGKRTCVTFVRVYKH